MNRTKRIVQYALVRGVVNEENVILIGSTPNQLSTPHEEVANGLEELRALGIGQVPVLTCEAVGLPKLQVRDALQARNLFSNELDPRSKVLLQH